MGRGWVDSETVFGKPCARIREQVCDALLMIEYAVQSGFKNADGATVPTDIIASIEMVAADLGLLDTKSSSDAVRALPPAVPTPEWIGFEAAYYRLSTIMAPVTAETLRNTEGTSREPEALAPPDAGPIRKRLEPIGNFILGYSPAHRFSRALWLAAIGFALFVVASQWFLETIATEGDDSVWRKWRIIVQLLVPWSYGGLGSCVYLLKSAHIYIYQRTFDLRRKHEYFNRILLGTIAGGAIILLVNQITGEGGVTIQLSSAALGFLAGYSTDFLFSTIERVITAILPKVGLDSVQRVGKQGVPRAAALDVRDLADRYDKAQGPAKDFYKTLIEHASGVPGGEQQSSATRGRRRRRSTTANDTGGGAPVG